MHTYRITATRPGCLERSHIKELADIFAAVEWAKRRYPHGSVRLCIEQVRLRPQGPDTLGQKGAA